MMFRLLIVALVATACLYADDNLPAFAVTYNAAVMLENAGHYDEAAEKFIQIVRDQTSPVETRINAMTHVLECTYRSGGGRNGKLVEDLQAEFAENVELNQALTAQLVALAFRDPREPIEEVPADDGDVPIDVVSVRQVVMDGLSLKDAVERLRALSEEVLPARHGINISMIGDLPRDDVTIELNLKDVTIHEAMQAVARQAKLQVTKVGPRHWAFCDPALLKGHVPTTYSLPKAAYGATSNSYYRDYDGEIMAALRKEILTHTDREPFGLGVSYDARAESLVVTADRSFKPWIDAYLIPLANAYRLYSMEIRLATCDPALAAQIDRSLGDDPDAAMKQLVEGSTPIGGYVLEGRIKTAVYSDRILAYGDGSFAQIEGSLAVSEGVDPGTFHCQMNMLVRHISVPERPPVTQVAQSWSIRPDRPVIVRLAPATETSPAWYAVLTLHVAPAQTVAVPPAE